MGCAQTTELDRSGIMQLPAGGERLTDQEMVQSEPKSCPRKCETTKIINRQKREHMVNRMSSSKGGHSATLT